MLQGRFAYHLDEKGRLKLPSELAPELGSAFTITRGQDGCLWLLPDKEWRAIAERLRGESLFDRRILALQRWFIGSATEVTVDGQGRITVPPYLRELAGVEREVVLVGMIDRVELWDRGRWQTYSGTQDDESIGELARSVGL